MGDRDSGPPPDVPGDIRGLIESPLPAAFLIKRNRNDQIDIPPQLPVPPEGFVDRFSEDGGQRPAFPVLQE